jgi:hypothetical protein
MGVAVGLTWPGQDILPAFRAKAQVASNTRNTWKFHGSRPTGTPSSWQDACLNLTAKNRNGKGQPDLQAKD